MTALELVLSLHEVCQFRSQERPPGKASNSEIRRILDQRGISINGETPKSKDKVALPVRSIILFPKSKNKRCTLL